LVCIGQHITGGWKSSSPDFKITIVCTSLKQDFPETQIKMTQPDEYIHPYVHHFEPISINQKLI
jgi:hypothetical protein